MIKYQTDKYTLRLGKSEVELKEYPDNYFDSVVTDPPYELGFMGKGWDKSGIAFDKNFWKEVLRVLKPGGHILAFSGTRTYHRMACAIEDAGFEIRDQIQWLYGQGFPKSMDISKAIDDKLGLERKVIGKSKRHSGQSFQWAGEVKHPTHSEDKCVITAPASGEAKQWEGWGTALKPANEPIVLARKPISEKTVAENVLKWGVGGLNIDGSRIGEGVLRSTGNGNRARSDGWGMQGDVIGGSELGRWPANVINTCSCERMKLKNDIPPHIKEEIFKYYGQNPEY